jgi:hypothetical protein
MVIIKMQIEVFIMKKIFILLLVCLSLIGCNKVEEPTEEVSILTPYGTPYLSLVGLEKYENVKIDAVNGPQNLQSALVSGSYDIVVAPVNLGANLYNKGNSKYKLAAVITMNNAYIVTKEENKLTSLDDLASEKVLAFGQTGVPGKVLTKLYSQHEKLDINDVDFTHASSSAVYSLFAGGSSDAKYALMSEPEISKLVLNNKINIKTLDLCSLLDSDVAQACVFVNPDTNKLDDVNKVLSLISNNISYLNNKPKEYARYVVSIEKTYETMGVDVIVRSIPLSNIVYKEGSNFKEMINNTLNMLGVKCPDDSFYYQG